MSKKKLRRPSIEALESRIAPAAVAAPLPTIAQAELAWDKNQTSDTHFVSAVPNTPLILHAGQVLTNGVGARAGQYLMFVQKGTAEIFTTDLNNNGQVDFNEITGVAAGDGLRLISFVDIHGDIVTNLDADTTLSDSANNAANTPVTHGDGRVLNNSVIESISMRSLTPADLTTTDGAPGTAAEVQLRIAFTSYSIFGEILAGKGFGVANDPTSGLLIDASGSAVQKTVFDNNNPNYFVPVKPTVGAIRTGTAASGEYFSFGYSSAADTQGSIGAFTAPAGQVGGDIVNVSSPGPFNFSGAYAGDGGFGARGGNIVNVQLNGDDTGGYNLVAGNGGRGTTGGSGGSIVNFTDLGSVTGQVLVKTGDGGQGTNGLGGNGGTLGFGTETVSPSIGVTEVANLNVNAGLTINLGNGGTGFRGGGNGASLSNLILRSPDALGVYGITVVGTTHDGTHDPVTGKLNGPNIIGNGASFDFDGDGNNDILYTTALPNQLWVAFGDGNGDFTQGRAPIPLDGPSMIQAATVADVNGDGHPDVVVGSAQAGDFSGLTVFLSKYKNVNGQDQFQGFSSPLISPLPGLDSGDPASKFTRDFDYRRSSNPITSITAGDFDGDGHTDIAISAAYITLGTVGATGTGAATINQVVMVMTSDIENGFGTGHFYADFGTKAGNAQPAKPLEPFFTLGTSPNAKLQATALSGNSPYDLVTALITNGTLALGSVTGVSSVPLPPGATPGGAVISLIDFHDKFHPSQLGSIKFAQVDTNRALTQATLVTATLLDYAIIDFNGDHKADFIALSDTPTGYLVGFQGSGAGNGGSTALTNSVITVPGDNFGYSLGGSPTTLRGSTPDGTGAMTGVVVLSGGSLIDVTFLTSIPPGGGLVLNPGVQTMKTIGSGLTDPKSINAFDTYIQTTGGTSDDVAFVFSPASNVVAHIETTSDKNTFQIALAKQRVDIIAGDGGVGQIGQGGNGGSLGNGKLTDTGKRLEGSIDYTLPATDKFTVRLFGGFGGDGFSTGGAGGTVGGVAVRFNPDATLVSDSIRLQGGDGGAGNSGAGGAGGSVVATTTVYGTLVGGLGGNGLTGGNGGSVIGHGFKGYSDDKSVSARIFAGAGGDGIRKGGAGGSISNFHTAFSISLVNGSSGGVLDYEAGDGGSASAGPGGAGGDIISVSAFTGGANATGDNLLAGDILMIAGNGGDGTIGGRGGIISDFLNHQTGDLPGVIAFIAGNGGAGSRGNGGAGGNVQNLSVSSAGTHNVGTTKIFGSYTYNHIVAGAGGSSSSATGGVGGSVLNVNTTASENTYAIAAGAGGAGLLVGGAGGSIKSLGLAVGNKGLIVAGSGGSAGAFVGDTAGSPTGIGGTIGRGGAGGSITGFTQTGGLAVHFDLIAGNGGDSLNFGSRSSTIGVKYVGAGGSVSNVSVQGNLGNTDPSVPIKSYNDILNGVTMAQFVDTVLRDPLQNVSAIDDTHGNVGIIVGASGRLNSLFAGYNSQNQAIFKSIPAYGAVNGDLLNVKASGVVAAVAGSVDQIAAIRTVRNLLSSDPKLTLRIGFDKDSAPFPPPVAPPNTLQYRSGEPDGMITDPVTGQRVYPSAAVLEGGLIDGALVAATSPVGSLFSGNSHVFVTTQ